MKTNIYYMVVYFTEKDGSRGVEWYEIATTESVRMALWKAWTEATRIEGRKVNHITEVNGIQSMRDLTNLIAFGINPKYAIHYDLHLFDKEEPNEQI